MYILFVLVYSTAFCQSSSFWSLASNITDLSPLAWMHFSTSCSTFSSRRSMACRCCVVSTGCIGSMMRTSFKTVLRMLFCSDSNLRHVLKRILQQNRWGREERRKRKINKILKMKKEKEKNLSRGKREREFTFTESMPTLLSQTSTCLLTHIETLLIMLLIK